MRTVRTAFRFSTLIVQLLGVCPSVRLSACLSIGHAQQQQMQIFLSLDRTYLVEPSRTRSDETLFAYVRGCIQRKFDALQQSVIITAHFFPLGSHPCLKYQKIALARCPFMSRLDFTTIVVVKMRRMIEHARVVRRMSREGRNDEKRGWRGCLIMDSAVSL